MQAFMIFDHMNDLVFSQMDKNFSEHVFQLALQAKLIEEIDTTTSIESYLSKDVIVQIFSPLVTSYKVMQGQFGRRYQSMEMEDGTLLVFRKILNCIAICVGSENKGIEMTHKEISIFLTFLNMLYGPALYFLNETIFINRGSTRQEMIKELVDEWRILRSDHQMFLVEAIERLLLNPEIAAISVNLLQEVLHKARSCPGNGRFNHSFLLVDYRLLALYSSRNSTQLPKKCVMLLIVLAKILNSAGQKDAYSSCRSLSNPVEEKITKKVYSRGKDSSDHANSCLIFLPSQQDDVVPHIVYVLKISQNITLVLLSELAGKTPLSRNLIFLIRHLDNLQNHPTRQEPFCSFETLENVYQDLMSTIEKLKLADDAERCVKLLALKWEQLKQLGIEAYLQSNGDKLLDSRLESIISSVCEICKVVFGEVVFRPALKCDESSEYELIFPEIKKMCSKRLKDCASYLEVKAEQNISMASYVSDFSGLIHFIYVDRNSDTMIAPSVVLTEGHLKGTASLKKKIWEMVDFGRKYVNGANSFLITWHHEDLRYFYSIWFEDSDGRNIKPVENTDITNLHEKEILCGNFFKELTKKCFPDASYDHIYCYELFCVHLVTISPSEVIEQSKRLAARLWEFSGAHRVSLDLL